MPDFTGLIRQAVARNNYVISYHARKRKNQRGMTYQEIKQAILHGEVIERNPRAEPHPKCLFMYPIRSEEPLYVVCGYNHQQQCATIITVHWFDPEKWIDWRTRQSKE